MYVVVPVSIIPGEHLSTSQIHWTIWLSSVWLAAGPREALCYKAGMGEVWTWVVLAGFVEALWRLILQNLPTGDISPLFLWKSEGRKEKKHNTYCE